MNQNKRLREILIQFLIYVSLFIGTGFLSGSIVHFPLNPVRFSVLGILGAVIFVIASTVNEAFFNENTFKAEGLVKVIFFSLVLSLGIGMISGGVQHFDEFPQYASMLIPFGIVISLVGYLLKSNIKLHTNQMAKLGAFTAVLVLFLGVTLRVYAQSLPAEEGEHAHGATQTESSEQTMEEHAAEVNDDQSFITAMIPHHEEAIASSEEILKVTKNSQIRSLAQTIISAQKQEVAQMKEWHSTWFTTPYQSNESYKSMMPTLPNSSAHEAEETYLQGMIDHHKGAVVMAEAIQNKTQRSEIQSLTQSIISTQNQEIETMEKLLVTIEGSTSGH